MVVDMKNLLAELEDHAKWVREHAHEIDKEAALKQGFDIVEKELKPEQQEDVKLRVKIAVSLGWSQFYFWVYEGDAQPNQLFGLNSATGWQEQVPFFETFEHQKELNLDAS